MTCSWIVHNLFTICFKIFPSFLTTFSWLVHDFFIRAFLLKRIVYYKVMNLPKLNRLASLSLAQLSPSLFSILFLVCFLDVFWVLLGCHADIWSHRGHFVTILSIHFCQNPNSTSTQQQFNESWVWYENDFAHHPTTTPHKLHIRNISAVTNPIWTKL